MRFSSQSFAAIVLFAALNQAACAGTTLPPMQPDRPVEIQHGFLGARYEQDGRPINQADLLEHLEQDPAAAPAASRYKTLMVVTTGLAAVGGGLIGWPIGQKLAGEEKPIWPLAYAGVGAVLLTIPLGVWANSSLNSAVEAFNQRLPRPADASGTSSP